MSNNAFSSLLCAIASSIVEAQQKMEQAQISNFINYFKSKEGIRGLCPRTLKLALPSLRPDAKENERDSYRIPYLSIFPHSGLRIDKTEVDFSITINGLLDGEDGPKKTLLKSNNDKEVLGDLPEEVSSIDDLPGLSIDLNGVWGKSKGLKSQVKFTVSSVDLPEGIMRMIDEVSKSNQGYKYSSSTQENN